MNEIHRHEQLKQAYGTDTSLQSVTNIIGTIKKQTILLS
jgi:hypothetical protein